MLVFKTDSNKKDFYSLMGQYFAERKYKKLMPYLVNDEDMTWYVNAENDEVKAFISFSDKGSKIHLGYCFADNDKAAQSKLLKKVIKDFPDRAMYVELEKHFDKELYLKLGFEIYKESANYWFLERRIAD